MVCNIYFLISKPCCGSYYLMIGPRCNKFIRSLQYCRWLHHCPLYVISVCIWNLVCKDFGAPQIKTFLFGPILLESNKDRFAWQIKRTISVLIALSYHWANGQSNFELHTIKDVLLLKATLSFAWHARMPSQNHFNLKKQHFSLKTSKYPIQRQIATQYLPCRLTARSIRYFRPLFL